MCAQKVASEEARASVDQGDYQTSQPVQYLAGSVHSRDTFTKAISAVPVLASPSQSEKVDIDRIQ
jgi:hypothetical protein